MGLEIALFYYSGQSSRTETCCPAGEGGSVGQLRAAPATAETTAGGDQEGVCLSVCLSVCQLQCQFFSPRNDYYSQCNPISSPIALFSVN